jgi:hypothetical protein
MSSPQAVVLPPHDALKEGTRLGRFRIEGMRSRDWFAITYRARDLQTGSEIALKEYLPIHFAARQSDGTVLPLSAQQAGDFLWGRKQFVAETAAMSQVGRTPGLVSVLGTFELNGTAYMAMAARHGTTLADRLAREGSLSPVVVDRMLPSLLKGLERLHAGGLLHLDIRPANIILDARGQATLLECGGTRSTMAMRAQAGPASRTPGYSALELFAGEQAGPSTDIYSLAATLYHCVTGTAPMAAVNRLMDSMVPASQAAAGGYPPGLLAGIDAGLALKAIDRPLTVATWRPRFAAASRAKGPVARNRRQVPRPLPEARPATVIPGDAAGIPLPPAATDRLRHLGRTAILMVSLLVLATAAAAVGGYALRQPTIERAAEERAQAETLQREAEEAAAREQAAAEARRQAAEAARREAQAKAEAEAEALRRYMARQSEATAEALRRMEEEAARQEREDKANAAAAARREAEEEGRFDSEAEKARKRAEEQARLEAEALRKTGDDKPRAVPKPRPGAK